MISFKLFKIKNRDMCKSKISLLFLLQILIVSMNTYVEDGNISGQVKDEENEDALPGATILLENTQFGTSTDKDGTYSFANVPEGEYTISVTYIGYDNFSTTVQVQENQDIPLNIELKPTKYD